MGLIFADVAPRHGVPDDSGRATRGPSVLIFSDLDGTLLDARTYSFREAGGALHLARERGVPVILASSKTRGEIEVYRRLLDNGHPFISENGGGVFVPEGYFPFPVPGAVPIGGYEAVILGRPYAEVRRLFVGARRVSGVPAVGFGDLTPGDLARLTGLPPAQATLAAERDFEEPFLPPEDPAGRERFLRALHDSGLTVTEGRFHHAMGDHDKGRAVGLLVDLFRRAGGRPLTAGIGDGLNDLPLLAAVDRPYLVGRPEGGYEERVALPGLVRTPGVGPAGWAEAVMGLLGP